MKIIRKLGQGDVEHVRAQLLQVGIFYQPALIKQLDGAVSAATQLGMMLRAHFCPYSQQDAREAEVLMIERQDHQLILHNPLSKAEFSDVFARCDLIVLPDRSEAFTAADVAGGIIETWYASKGRFVGGNFGFLPVEELKRRYPTFDIDITPFLERYADPV